ncbi:MULTISPECIES: hypothetical protein [unclassified Pseudomonas]|uniref:hypothetical protein n=1 Tax=unclassified Pseudomonas TaxID=196821 RepID=UPI000A1E69AC|nr:MULTISPECIES: hypothetical protein [unclassified Pseudomonas]
MTIDKEKLKALAERAIANNHPGGGGNPFPALAVRAVDVLTLLAEIERLEVDNGSIRGSTKRMGEDASRAQKQARKTQREIDQLKAENESLTAKIECFDEGMRAIASTLGAGGYNAEYLSAADLVEKVRWGVDHLCDVHERRLGDAKAENEAQRKDAERYRWLRDRCGIVEYKAIAGSIGPGMLPSGEKLEMAIDAVISKGEQS